MLSDQNGIYDEVLIFSPKISNHMNETEKAQRLA